MLFVGWTISACHEFYMTRLRPQGGPFTQYTFLAIDAESVQATPPEMGAILLSLLISTLWLHTAYSDFQLLIGVTADTSMQQWITYISMTHSILIRQNDTVRAYHSGPRLVVEVDIVMDREETLRFCHDTAEELQMKLESLPDVERAYVHIDFETSHKPEHFLKKEL